MWIRLNSGAFSYCGQWPQSSITTNVASGIIDAISAALADVRRRVLARPQHQRRRADAPYSSGVMMLRARMSGSWRARMSLIATTNPGVR